MRSTVAGLWVIGAGIAMLAGCVAVEPGGGQGPVPGPVVQGSPSGSMGCLARARPVCGQIGNLSPRTYGNACAARDAGATIISDGRCNSSGSYKHVMGKKSPGRYKRVMGKME